MINGSTDTFLTRDYAHCRWVLGTGNYRRVINDCTEATKLNEKNSKAYYRACTACIKLDK